MRQQNRIRLHAAGGGGFASDFIEIAVLNAPGAEFGDLEALGDAVQPRNGIAAEQRVDVIELGAVLDALRICFPNGSEQGSTHSTMRCVKHAANRCGKAVDGSEAGVSEGDAAVEGTEGHVFTGVEIVTLLKSAFERAHGTLNAVEAQRIGHRLRTGADEGFEALRERVHAAGGGDVRREIDGEFGVDQRDARQH